MMMPSCVLAHIDSFQEFRDKGVYTCISKGSVAPQEMPRSGRSNTLIFDVEHWVTKSHADPICEMCK